MPPPVMPENALAAAMARSTAQLAGRGWLGRALHRQVQPIHGATDPNLVACPRGHTKVGTGRGFSLSPEPMRTFDNLDTVMKNQDLGTVIDRKRPLGVASIQREAGTRCPRSRWIRLLWPGRRVIRNLMVFSDA